METLQFLLGIVLVLSKLAERLDVVGGVDVLTLFGELQDLLRDSREGLGVAADELLELLVEGGDTAGGLVETSTDGAVGSGFLVEEGSERGFGAAAFVGGGFGAAFGEEFQCGVAGHSVAQGDSLAVGGVGVNFGDDYVGVVGEVVGEDFIDGGKGFAVAAPGL